MLSLRIALRYLLAPKSHRAVNVISIISIAGVAVATMATVVVLSVFNGFTWLAHTRLGRIDPMLKVCPASGKTIANADSVARLLCDIDGVASAMPLLAERGLLASEHSQQPVRVMGIDPTAYNAPGIDPMIIDGSYATHAVVGSDTVAATQLSVGVALNTGLRPGVDTRATLYVPRRLGRINPANPAAAYRTLPLAVSGVFQVDQAEYDTDCIFVPIENLQSLLLYDNGEATSISVDISAGVKVNDIRKTIERTLGSDYLVLDREHQQADTFRMISIEKWVTFLMLVFILAIASFNIVSTLSLLILEKRDNMETLRAIGAPQRMVDGIFASLGWLITAIGGALGVVVGTLLSLAQQHLGFIKLDGDPTALSIDAYPVRVEWPDMVAVLAVVMAVGIAVAALSRVFIRKLKPIR